jgi:predicted AlkP superfamily pyrophosphatase or phosphodiesterase
MMAMRFPFLILGVLQSPGPVPLVFVGVDGLRPDYVLEAERHGLQIPNLRRMLSEGASATAVRGVLPTVTYPSFTTLITGVEPARHGIVANTTFDPLQKNSGGWYWYTEDIRVPTLWDVFRKAGRKVAILHWPVSVGAKATWNLPQLWRSGTPDDRKLLRALATPGLQGALEAELGIPYPDGIDESLTADLTRGRFAEALLARKPDLLTAYFTALDHVEHESGPFSPEANRVLEAIDSIIGRLRQAARRVYGSRVVFAIASDHGFAATSRQVNLPVMLANAGLVRLGADGKPAAWDATAWTTGGSAAVMLREAKDSVTARKARELFERAARDTTSGIARILSAEQAVAMGGFPGAAFIVALRPGFQFGGNTSGDVVTAVRPGGTHGYPPDVPEMRSAFFVVGPGVRAGRRLGEIDMRAIAPTLARLAGLTLASAALPPLW